MHFTHLPQLVQTHDDHPNPGDNFQNAHMYWLEFDHDKVTEDTEKD